jgi:hypothetical protein
MLHAGRWEPSLLEVFHSRPVRPVTVASTSQSATPRADELRAERRKRVGVRRHGVIREVAADHLAKPTPLFVASATALGYPSARKRRAA